MTLTISAEEQSSIIVQEATGDSRKKKPGVKSPPHPGRVGWRTSYGNVVRRNRTVTVVDALCPAAFVTVSRKT